MNILSLLILVCSISILRCQKIQIETRGEDAGSNLNCIFNIEMAYLLEASGSQTSDNRLIAGQSIQNIIDAFSLQFNDMTSGTTIKSGVTIFSDKPIPPFGSTQITDTNGNIILSDTCGVHVKSFDNIRSDSSLATKIQTELERSGGDLSSNQLGVLYDVLSQNENYDWSQSNVNSDDLPIIKLIVMYTRSPYHSAGEGLPNLTPVSNDENSSMCDVNDYPKVQDVSKRVNDISAYTFFVTENNPDVNTNLEAVYKELSAHFNRKGYIIKSPINRNWASSMYNNIIGIFQNICDTALVVDVVFVIDLSYSYKDDLQKYKNMVYKSIKKMNVKYMALRVGLASFIDKPTLGLGDRLSGDYCYRLHLPLTYDIDEFHNQLDMLQSSSGLDWKEAQLVALRSVSIDPNVGWRRDLTWNGFQLKRIVVMATDSGYHVSNDLENAARKYIEKSRNPLWDNYANGPLEGDLENTPQYQDVNPINIAPDNEIGDCNHSEYPTFNDVEGHMMGKKLYLSIITSTYLFEKYFELLNSLPGVPSSIGNISKNGEILISINAAFEKFDYI